MINNHELRRRIEEVKKDLRILEKQVLELDYQIAPEVTGKAEDGCEHEWGNFSLHCMTCQKCGEERTIEDKEVTDVTKECQEHTLDCVPIAYKNGLTDGRKQAIAEMKERFEGRVNWLSDEYGSRKDFIINLRRNLFHPEEKE